MLESLTKNKTILVCPLDWGLGHATRMVPIIELLNKSGANVIIGADNRPLAFLKQRFPAYRFIKFPGFVPKYPKSGSMGMMMVKSFPKMIASAKRSNQLLQEIVEEEKVDIVISDNRYELYSDKAYTIFITHQLNIQTPGLSFLVKPLIQKTINRYIKKFDELWIPDFPEKPGLSGALSHLKKMPISNYHFIGPLSRFSLVEINETKNKIDLLLLLSGPEPQRTLLEQLLTEQALETNLTTIIVQGKPELSKEKIIDNVRLIPHLDDEQMAMLVTSTDFIICRPGYSTIMDLATLNKKAILIPTPGQTEQEYLAKRFMKERKFYSETQENFNLIRAIENQKKYSGVLPKDKQDLLEVCLSNLLHKN